MQGKQSGSQIEKTCRESVVIETWNNKGAISTRFGRGSTASQTNKTKKIRFERKIYLKD